MKAKIFCSILFVLFIFACGNKSKNTASIDGIDFDSIVVDTTAMLINEKNSPQCHIKLSIQYARGENSKKINHAILHSGVAIPDYFFIGHKDMEISSATKFFAKRLIEEYLEDYTQLYKQDKNNPQSYEYRFFVKTLTKNGDKNILIYQSTIDSFGGGPYGISQTIVKNININTGKIVTLDSLFAPGYEKTLEEIIINKLQEKFDCKNTEELRKKSIFIDGRVYASENFILDQDKITFIYCDSEIAPHDIGEIRIEIKKSELTNIIKK